jgi:hypothetical protein
MPEHTEDIRNIVEGDEVTITTTEGEAFDAECINRDTQHADPRSGEVRQTTYWKFDTPYGEAAASILEGLKSSPDDRDFPQHSELWHMDKGDGMGYIESVQIHGPDVQAEA